VLKPSPIEHTDSPPSGWFILDVMRREEGRKWDWTALMVDVDPEELRTCICDFPALFYVHPDEHHPGDRRARQCFVRIAGKHRSRDDAWDALEEMMATRH
jgi:hypothetical protein